MTKKILDVRSVDQLAALVAAGEHAKYQVFWGHTPRVPGQVDASCLSNWYPAPFVLDGQPYPTTEHHMMAEKARLFGDAATEGMILAAESPGKAKALGRRVAGFDDVLWTRHRFAIVVAGNLAKFQQNLSLRDYLLATGTKVLVEASPYDPVWGIGLSMSDPAADDPHRWRGLNLLGFALMEVRARLSATAGADRAAATG